MATFQGTNTEYFSVFREVLGRAIYRGNDTECYCVCVSSCGRQYRHDLIMNIAVFCENQVEGNIDGTDTECYRVCFEGLLEGNI